MGRIKEAKTGAEANGGTVDPEDQEMELPYRQSYNFNEYNNLTQRNNLHWGKNTWYGRSNNLNYAYHNNRIVNTGWQHDADGRVTVANEESGYSTSEYDAKGQLIKIRSSTPFINSEKILMRYYDGNGREVKQGSEEYVEIETSPYFEWQTRPTKYFIRSSVLGNATINEVDATGKRVEAYIFAAGAKIATQYGQVSDTNHKVIFHQADASVMSHRSTRDDGHTLYAEGFDGAPAETDPMGNNAGLESPYLGLGVGPVHPEIPMLQPLDEFQPMYINGQYMECQLDGMSIGCGQLASMSADSLAVEITDPNGFIHQVGVERILGQLWIPNSASFYQNPGGWEYREDQWLFGGVSSFFTLTPNHNTWYIVGFDDNKYKVINDLVKSTYENEECSKAFEDAGLESVNTIMNNGSLIFVREGVVANDSLNRWYGDEEIKSALLKGFNSGLNVMGVGIIGNSHNGNYYVGLRERAFTGEYGSAIDIIIHELIHVAGNPGNAAAIAVNQHEPPGNYNDGRTISRTRTPEHDLDWMNYENGEYTGKYDNIIEKCKPN